MAQGREIGLIIKGNEVAGPIDVEVWSVAFFGLKQTATMVTSSRQLHSGILQLGIVPQGIQYLAVAVTFQKMTCCCFLTKDGVIRAVKEAITEVESITQPLFSRNSLGNLTLSQGYQGASVYQSVNGQLIASSTVGQSILQSGTRHYATRVTMSKALQGAWLHVEPQKVVKNVVFYQTVLTFQQIIAEVTQLLQKDYGVQCVEREQILTSVQNSITKEKPILTSDGCIKLKIYVNNLTYIGYFTPVEQLLSNRGATEVFLKEPDKLVIANVETHFGKQMLVSDPTEFSQSQQQYKNYMEILKIGSKLLAVYFTEDKKELIRSYTFYRGTTERFEQTSPEFDLKRLRDIAGKYHVQIKTNKFAVVSDQIQLDHAGNIVQLEPSESSYESSSEPDLAEFQPFDSQAPQIIYEGPHHSSTVQLAEDLSKQVETLRSQLLSLQKGMHENHQTTLEEMLQEDQQRNNLKERASEQPQDDGLHLKEKSPVKIIVRPPRPRQIPMASSHVKVQKQINNIKPPADETYGPGFFQEPDVIKIEPKVHESPVFTMKKPQKTQIPRDAVAELNRFKDEKPSFGGRIDPRDTPHFNPITAKKEDKEMERAIYERQKEAGLLKKEKKRSKGLKSPPEYDRNTTSPRPQTDAASLKQSKLMTRHKDGLQTDIYASPKAKGPIALSKADLDAHYDPKTRIALPTEEKMQLTPKRVKRDMRSTAEIDSPKIRFPRYEAFQPQFDRFVEPYEKQERKSTLREQETVEDPQMIAWQKAVSYKEKRGRAQK